MQPSISWTPVEMRAATAVTLIFAALIATMILPAPSNAAALPEDLDRPNPDYTAMFKAFVDMGNAIFGNWTPEEVIEDFIRNRE